MSIPRYEGYKGSGIEWLGDLPSHWHIEPLKYNSYIKGRIGWQNLRSEEFIDDGPFLVTGMHFRNGKVAWEECYHISEERYEIAPEIQLKPNDVLITKDGTIGKLAYVDRLPGLATLNSHLLVLRPLQKTYDPRFLYHVLSSTYFRTYSDLHQSGTTFFGITQETVENFPLWLPPVAEQHAISTFLDRETGKIDALVEGQKWLIALLKEKRQALISNAVTKGINRNAPMKDSGNEWLGEVPAHWRILPLGRVVDRIEQGWSPPAYEREPDEGEASVLRLSAIKDGVFNQNQRKALPDLDRKTLDGAPTIAAGDFLLTRANTPDLVGDCAIAGDVKDTIFSDLIYRLTFSSRDMHPKFAVLALRAAPVRAQVRRDARGSSMSMAKLSHGHIKAWTIALPPLDEQLIISAFVTSELDRFDRLLTQAEAAIALLQERRAALISAAVTGKIDVRGLAPSQAEAA